MFIRLKINCKYICVYYKYDEIDHICPLFSNNMSIFVPLELHIHAVYTKPLNRVVLSRIQVKCFKALAGALGTFLL